MKKPLFKPQDLARVSPFLAFFVLSLLVARFLLVVIIAKEFGTTEFADVLFIAQLIPITLFLQNRKALMSSVVPVYTEYVVGDDEEAVWSFTNQLTSLVVIGGILVTAIYVVVAPVLILPMTPGFKPEQRSLTIHFTQLLSPIILFLILFSLLESLLYTYKHFTTTSWAILFGVIGGVVGLFLLTDRYGLFGYGYGSLAGYFLQFAIPLSLFWKYRHRFKFCLNVKDPGIVKLYKLLLPIYLYSILATLMHLTSRAMATTLGSGRVSAFQYGLTLIGVLPLVVTQTILAPLFPTVSEQVVRREFEGLKDLLVKGTQILFFVVAPIVAALICLRVPVVRMLFQRGEFTAQDTSMTANTLIFFAPIILAMTLDMLYSQLIVNLGLIYSAIKLSVVLLVLNLLFCMFFMKFFDVGGIALSLTLVYFLMSWVLILFVRGRIGPIGFTRLLRPSVKVLAACFLSTLPLAWLIPHLESYLDMSRVSFQLIGLVIGGVCYFSFYAFLVWVFRMEEPQLLLQVARGRKKTESRETSVLMMGGGGG